MMVSLVYFEMNLAFINLSPMGSHPINDFLAIFDNIRATLFMCCLLFLNKILLGGHWISLALGCPMWLTNRQDIYFISLHSMACAYKFSCLIKCGPHYWMFWFQKTRRSLAASILSALALIYHWYRVYWQENATRQEEKRQTKERIHRQNEGWYDGRRCEREGYFERISCRWQKICYGFSSSAVDPELCVSLYSSHETLIFDLTG